jgi:hypothetical protein
MIKLIKSFLKNIILKRKKRKYIKILFRITTLE